MNIYSILLVGTFVLLAQIGLYVFNLIYRQPAKQGNEVAGIMFGGISMIYSLVLAFVIVAVWENYEGLNKTIENETDKINSIMAHTSTLPDSLKTPLNFALYNYCNQVVKQEWRMKAANEQDQPSAIPGLRMMLLKHHPADKMQEGVFNVIDLDLSAISDLRRDRLSHNRSQVPPIVWLILKIGSVMLVVFSYFFNVPSQNLKRIYLFFLSSFIGMCMFLLYTLDHPFNGSSAISYLPYNNIIRELKQYYVFDIDQAVEKKYTEIPIRPIIKKH
ncbi:DUF4239 domain-containing protein [Mucilaginibacter aquaedulcis]|uniref:bestrophin-like domain n=1 Tax=Mucilaginibacter aquaedulcis TaxID=1187081 RepID=UPI0025B32020|nr:DUF4239 domain-containing protein [Mucilaginibacter aquaedulcis]MDN3550028.1 DUF4239 domain-containing protein [Mucilaginibacter aquaedulcis]